jgi:hypothetical protein
MPVPCAFRPNSGPHPGQNGLAHRSILTSFNPEVLGTVRNVTPHIRTLSPYGAKSAEKGLLHGIEYALRVSDIIDGEDSSGPALDLMQAEDQLSGRNRPASLE